MSAENLSRCGYSGADEQTALINDMFKMKVSLVCQGEKDAVVPGLLGLTVEIPPTAPASILADLLTLKDAFTVCGDDLLDKSALANCKTAITDIKTGKWPISKSLTDWKLGQKAVDGASECLEGKQSGSDCRDTALKLLADMAEELDQAGAYLENGDPKPMFKCVIDRCPEVHGIYLSAGKLGVLYLTTDDIEKQLSIAQDRIGNDLMACTKPLLVILREAMRQPPEGRAAFLADRDFENTMNMYINAWRMFLNAPTVTAQLKRVVESRDDFLKLQALARLSYEILEDCIAGAPAHDPGNILFARQALEKLCTLKEYRSDAVIKSMISEEPLQQEIDLTLDELQALTEMQQCKDKVKQNAAMKIKPFVQLVEFIFATFPSDDFFNKAWCEIVCKSESIGDFAPLVPVGTSAEYTHKTRESISAALELANGCGDDSFADQVGFVMHCLNLWSKAYPIIQWADDTDISAESCGVMAQLIDQFIELTSVINTRIKSYEKRANIRFFLQDAASQVSTPLAVSLPPCPSGHCHLHLSHGALAKVEGNLPVEASLGLRTQGCGLADVQRDGAVGVHQRRRRFRLPH